MYDRELKDRELNFSFSGMLWNNNLVMVDDETRSLWCHTLAKCVRGDLIETELEIIPSVVTDWASWKKSHPGTTVLNHPLPAERVAQFQMDTATYVEKRHGALVAGVEIQQQSKTYSFGDLARKSLINDFIGQHPVAIVFDANSNAVRCYDRQVGDQVVELVIKDKKLIDVGTQKEWDADTGVGLLESDTNSDLRRIPITVSKARPWNVFHPDSKQWSE